MPRKPKLTETLIARIEKSIQGHISIKETCERVGITEQTFYRWIREGEELKGGLKGELSQMVKRARAISKMILVKQISQDPSWQAKAWILERRYPQEFGRRIIRC